MTTSNYPYDNFFANSRLSSLFTPIKDTNNHYLYQMNEPINTKMIQKGMQLNKIGVFEPSEVGKNSNWTNKTVINEHSYNNTQSMKRHGSFSDFHFNFSNENHFKTPSVPSNVQDIYRSLGYNIPSTPGDTATNINNTVISQQNRINQIKPFDVLIEGNNQELYGLSSVKKKKFITKDANCYEDNSKFTIEANKMTKKLIEDHIISQISEEHSPGISANCNGVSNIFNQSNKATRNTSLIFQDNNASNITYQYLLDKFDDEYDESFDFNNIKLTNKYKEFIDAHHDELLSFGENPLNKFQDWLTWLNQEQDKETTEQSKQLCDDIVKTLNSISGIMSSLPILVCPNQKRTNSFDFLRKQSKKKKELGTDNEDKKLFCCELCFEPFKTGQGLGGHMSRKHKDQSMKFKRKKEIRNKREPIRNILLQAKEKLCKNNCVDFEEKMKTKQGKKYIKWLILEHNEDYKKIRNELKRGLIAKN